MARTAPATSVENCGSKAREVKVTSSWMPMVKWFLGRGLSSSSKTP